MNYLKYLLILSVLSVFLHACGKDDVDTEKPTIDIDMADAFPVNCSTLYFDEPFTVKMRFSDNVELGSYSIDIHHNFDHHSHSTELTMCDLDDLKDPVNPYLFIDDFSIPEGSADYVTNQSFTIPSSDGTITYEDGDYHFSLSLTDKEGWSSQVGLNVKLRHR